MTKPAERAAARRLRVRGMPYKRIAALLAVSPGSAYAWTRDIDLTPEQVERNRRGPGAPWNAEDIRRRAATWSARCRHRRLLYQEDGRRKAREGDPLHLTGCMLYWAEGAKSRNVVKLVNSDANMVRIFRRFLVQALNTPPDQIRFSVNVYTGNGLSLGEIEEHWLNVLELPRSCARKHMLNHMPTSSSGRARNKLPYGVCSVVVYSTWMVQHIYGAIQEYGGFDEPAWLD
jgi:hypothetical protein